MPGYICKKCQHGYTTKKSAASHWRTNHKDEEDEEKPQGCSLVDSFFEWVPQMQSLSHHSNFICYFRIIPNPAELDPVAPFASSDDMAMLKHLQDEVFGLDDEDDIGELDLAEVQEFFRNSGATNYVSGLDHTELIQLVGLPHSDELLLVKLHRAQSLRFESRSSCISRGNTAIRRLIVTTTQ